MKMTKKEAKKILDGIGKSPAEKAFDKKFMTKDGWLKDKAIFFALAILK